jgi:hypothetical protein
VASVAKCPQLKHASLNLAVIVDGPFIVVANSLQGGVPRSTAARPSRGLSIWGEFVFGAGEADLESFDFA